ncbi:methylmalonyl-CoA mutase [Pseudomaricurvus alkylphenolicus]|uniref:acyl-CoA mutase large subunit family protein n=1 Tax=Pseudomaricurvus alkylphenolicus TaxID=1306991 RepID=UPI001422AC8F|nr:acyl-CoA mutase large subunit family protein [Pseudomaricurvus alkylphenolicus]NIB40668.1 methylmalonyl-CoA mutase [Pseudomaricurvus alkylphenolicus]
MGSYEKNSKGVKQAQAQWQSEYAQQIGSNDRVIKNISGIEIEPLYTPEQLPDQAQYLDKQGFPGQFPYTRGIYPTMHRGRTWTQRQLIGLGTPDDYNERVRSILNLGANAISLLPCNSGFRGVDCDTVPLPLLGTCGTVVNTVDHMDTCLDGVPLDQISAAMNDPSPFTLFAFMLNVAKRRGISWDKITGTSNQSDYISHFVANHMFYRLSLPGSRRVLVDHIEYCREHVPNWNPMSIVGQHMQQAGATPAETIAFTFSSAIQHAEDCIARGMDPDSILPRFTFFFDISISFFEEVAKFRAARRIWARITRDRLGAKDPRSWRFKFHGQTSGVDLTAQQPLNNIARVAVQAMSGIFGGIQSMHTDAYDEPITCPTEETAKIAVATQNILREEAHLCDVIDPLGGSYYVERLTDQMEAEILKVMEKVDAAGGMYKAVETGLVQSMIGESAMARQEQIETGEEKIVGVNCYRDDEDSGEQVATSRPDPIKMQAHIDNFKAFKEGRSQQAINKALDNLTRAANSDDENVFARVVEAAEVGATHGEIIALLREELGFGHPLIVA